ncbi:hypothetical protein L1D46_19395 [Pseudoalteromonas sp. Isolate3]|uniref:hypothetical protein n=1 Tax=Pseudoalteromonas sp. Isolate3 TaxID=2908526 RepID=UPI001EFE1456|nr:hypothetical protein [Pseudoalteromonas sp. Isolate3]MCG9710938.1 hypothetical protein [Pseudoalteromonas sp. Isolate3]
MLKTPALRRYESNQININDQLCYYLFADKEVEQHLNAKTDLVDEKYTTEVFTTNNYAERLHVKISALGDFRQKSFHTFCGITLISSIEYLLSYVDDIQEFRSRIEPSAIDKETDEKPEIQLEKKLKSWIESDEIKGLIKTIKYLRLRRNHIAHVRSSLSDDLKALIKNDSNYLNKFWGKKKTNIYDFDFSNMNISEFGETEILAIVNLSGVCMKIIDELVIQSIDTDNIVKYEVIRFNEKLGKTQLPSRKKVSKFNGYLASNYGMLSISEEEYVKYVG